MDAVFGVDRQNLFNSSGRPAENPKLPISLSLPSISFPFLSTRLKSRFHLDFLPFMPTKSISIDKLVQCFLSPQVHQKLSNLFEVCSNESSSKFLLICLFFTDDDTIKKKYL